ncbi:MAG: DNA modification methylase [Planctomycetota bacterium]
METPAPSRSGVLNIRTVPLDSLHLDPSNVRTHDTRNLDAISASLKRFGQAEPLVVQRQTGRVIGGNGRLQAMKQLGWTDCEVVELDLDDLQATSLSIALNRTGELAGWDEPALVQLLEQLRREDGLEGVGFTTDDIDALVAQLREEEERQLVDEGPDEPPAVAIAKTGDLWQLGDHLLLCGDSTSLQDVRRVMGQDKAALVATDPPYLVDYTGERPNDSGKDWTATYREIDIQDADGFFRSVFVNVLDVLGPKGALYCWHAHRRLGGIQRIWRELGLLDHQQIIWVKPTPVFGRSYWHYQHEPCVMGWRQGDMPDHDGVHEYSSVWQVDWDGKARVVGNEHPTEKPVELFVRPIKKHTSPGDVVFEPFSGSGSQLIAAERTGRRCRAIEISAPYVDVAIKRWQKATGKDATLDGKTFAEVAVERGLASKE